MVSAHTWYDSDPFEYEGLVLWPSTWSVLVNILYTFEKDMYSAVVAGNVLQIIITSMVWAIHNLYLVIILNNTYYII